MSGHPRVERFEQALLDRLGAEGYVPVSERFPLAGHELGMLAYRALVKEKAGRTYVVTARRGEGLVREQLRALSDQFYNALVRERNELRRRPTLMRGICIFVFEQPPEPIEAQHVLQRVRPRGPLATIRSIPWIYELGSGRLRRPWLTRTPFPARLLEECRAAL